MSGARRAAILVLSLAVLAVAATTASAQQRPRVTLIGDSVATSFAYVREAPALLGRQLDLRLEVIPCRRLVQLSCIYQGTRPPTTLDVIQDRDEPLGKVVVVDVGYNDYPWLYDDDLDRVMRALVKRRVPTVLWVNMRDPRGQYRTINASIRAAESRWKQLELVDWDAYGAGRPAWFKDDGLHLTAEGTMALARLLRPYVLEAACPDGCTRRP